MTRWQLFGKFLTVPGIRNTLSAIRLISEFHWNCIYLLLVLDNERKGRRRRTKLWEVEEDRQIQLWKSLKYLRFWKWAKNSIVFRSHATDSHGAENDWHACPTISIGRLTYSTYLSVYATPRATCIDGDEQIAALSSSTSFSTECVVEVAAAE